MATDVLAELVGILELERIEENIFRGQSQNLGWGRVFGGQVVGQALSAAEQTVPEGRSVHSLHAYFLRPGDAERPIVFNVDPIRDGKSFTTRRVVAIQNGRPIFNLSASFQNRGRGFRAPDLHDAGRAGAGRAPEREGADDGDPGRTPGRRSGEDPPFMKERATAERPIDVRPVDPVNPLSPGVREPLKRVWFRANGALPDAPHLHQYLLAYASDFHLLSTSMHPHGVSWMMRGMQVASLDHALFFHRPFRFDEWMLYDMEAPTAQGYRGLSMGRWFTRDGVLVASSVQEGLIRDRRGEPRR